MRCSNAWRRVDVPRIALTCVYHFSLIHGGDAPSVIGPLVSRSLETHLARPASHGGSRSFGPRVQGVSDRVPPECSSDAPRLGARELILSRPRVGPPIGPTLKPRAPPGDGHGALRHLPGSSCGRWRRSEFDERGFKNVVVEVNGKSYRVTFERSKTESGMLYVQHAPTKLELSPRNATAKRSSIKRG